MMITTWPCRWAQLNHCCNCHPQTTDLGKDFFLYWKNMVPAAEGGCMQSAAPLHRLEKTSPAAWRDAPPQTRAPPAPHTLASACRRRPRGSPRTLRLWMLTARCSQRQGARTTPSWWAPPTQHRAAALPAGNTGTGRPAAPVAPLMTSCRGGVAAHLCMEKCGLS
jgi:hypothetical protein